MRIYSVWVYLGDIKMLRAHLANSIGSKKSASGIAGNAPEEWGQIEYTQKPQREWEDSTK